MSKFNWNETLNRLGALREEIEGAQEEESVEENEALEGLSLTQIAVLAEMLGVDVDTLTEADEETLQEAMSYLGYQLMASPSYGRAGMSGKLPWNRNESSVGQASPHASPSSDGLPGTKSATPPAKSSSKMSQKGSKHIRK